jgi:hypothetical protein
MKVFRSALLAHASTQVFRGVNNCELQQNQGDMFSFLDLQLPSDVRSLLSFRLYIRYFYCNLLFSVKSFEKLKAYF